METDTGIITPELRPYTLGDANMLLNWLRFNWAKFSPAAWNIEDAAQIAFVGRKDIAAACVEIVFGKTLSFQVLSCPDAPNNVAQKCLRDLIIDASSSANRLGLELMPPRPLTPWDFARLNEIGFSPIMDWEEEAKTEGQANLEKN